MKSTRVKKAVHHYTAVFEHDPEEGGYTVTIPALPGCISEGNTFEEALANIKEAAELYLEETPEGKDRRSFYKESGVVIAPVEVFV